MYHTKTLIGPFQWIDMNRTKSHQSRNQYIITKSCDPSSFHDQSNDNFPNGWCHFWRNSLISRSMELLYSENSDLTPSADVCHSERGTITPSVVPSLPARMPILTKTLGHHSQRGTITPRAVQPVQPRSEWGPTYFRWKRNECRFSEKWSVLANVWFIETERGTAVGRWHPVPFIKY